MGFYEEMSRYSGFDYEGFWGRVDLNTVADTLNKSLLDQNDFLVLLSPAAEDMLEEMAMKAHVLTLQHFGKVMFLYTPLYLSNYCINRCLYCGFNADNAIIRKKLTLAEVRKEGLLIAESGMRHILLLTGEQPRKASVDYIRKCAIALQDYFTSIAIEVYPLTSEEYSTLALTGVDGLTIYQEVYDERTYAEVHRAGPKRDYHFRLDAPERACLSGMRGVNLGALLGLNEWRREVFMAGLHCRYLQNKYLDVELSLSFPRLRLGTKLWEQRTIVSDRNLVQAMLAFRIFMPRAGITMSTRESVEMRDNLLPLGVTKMSAGSCTSVGGRLKSLHDSSQFAICDERTVQEVKQSIINRGYQPVFKDWHYGLVMERGEEI